MDRLQDLRQTIENNNRALEQDGPLTSIVDSVSRSINEDLCEEIQSSHEWQGTCAFLVEVVFELRTLTDKLMVKVDDVKEENVKLRKELSDHEQRLQVLEINRNKLFAGRLAFMMDKALLDRVLRDSRCASADERMINSIKSMEKAMRGEYPYGSVFNEEEKLRVQQQWLGLKKRLGWTADHDLGLRELKKQRLESAHPTASVDVMKAALQKISLAPKKKKVCMDFVQFLSTLSR